MKLAVLFCLVGLAMAAPRHDEILRYDNDYGFDGQYKWAFRTSNRISQEQEGNLKNRGQPDEALSVHGRYEWVAPDGVTYVVTYTADENGFQPIIEILEHRPPPPTVPPQVFASLIG